MVFPPESNPCLSRDESPRSQVPTRRVAERSRSSAIVDMWESLPVRGFSEGTFWISTASLPNSPSTTMRCRAALEPKRYLEATQPN